MSLVGRQQISATKLIQRKLGLSGKICSPDVPALAAIDLAHRPQVTRPRTEGRSGPRAANRSIVGHVSSECVVDQTRLFVGVRRGNLGRRRRSRLLAKRVVVAS